MASDLPGVRQPVMQTGLGCIVPLRDSEAMAAAIIEILEDSHFKQRIIPESYLARFDQEEVANQYSEIYERLIDERKS